MVTFPNAKINIGLNIVGKRPDGYHDIESCFYPIPWNDVLEIIESDSLSFQSTGIPIPGEANGNLCIKAYHQIRKDFSIPPVAIHLHKVIPIGAGLGGGSADGAFMLRLLNDKFELAISDDQLESYAAQLGADCPFFIQNKPTLASGIGNIFTPVSVDLTGFYIVLINPEIHIGTKEAYSGVMPKATNKPITSLLELPIDQWQSKVINDFEKSIFPNHPKIASLKERLLSLGAKYASMTGSGSTVFGLFDEQIDIDQLKPLGMVFHSHL